MDLATNVVADSLEGSSIKQSSEKRLEEAKKDIATVIRETRASSKRKKANPGGPKSKKKKNKKKLDIFNDDNSA